MSHNNSRLIIKIVKLVADLRIQDTDSERGKDNLQESFFLDRLGLGRLGG